MYHQLVKKKQEEALYKEARKGAVFRKHGRRGKPHDRYVMLGKDLDSISWKEASGDGNSGSSSSNNNNSGGSSSNSSSSSGSGLLSKKRRENLIVQSFDTIQKGCDTKLFKRNSKNLKPEHCFSLIGNERTLDLECSSQEMRDQWYEIFDCVLRRGVALKNDSKKFKEQEANIEKVTKALAKFTFDISSDTWKVSKLLTKNATFTEEEFYHLAHSLQNNPLVKIIDLSSVRLTEQAVTNLYTGLESAVSLTSLSLSGNEMTSAGVAELSRLFLKPSCKIKYLDLSHNSISDDGLEVLSNNLTNNKTLEELNLDGNMIGDLGAEALIEMLSSNTHLKSIRVNDNALQNDAVQGLCQCLKNPDTSLEFITVARNQVIFPEGKQRKLNENGEPDDSVVDAGENDICDDEEDQDHSLEINLFLAVDAGDYAEAVMLLLKGADPNVQNEEDGKTPLHIAAMRGDMKMLEFLITHPYIDMNALDDASTTPIHCAISHSQLDVVKLLLEKGADVNIPDAQRKTCVHIAAEQGNKMMCKLLIETYKADIRILTEQDQTPLHFASANLNKDVVHYLVDVANKQEVGLSSTPDFLPYVNWQDVNGETALHKALSTPGKKSDLLDVSKELVKNGADVSIEDTQAKTPLHDVDEEIRKVLLNETRMCAAKRK